MKTTKTSAAFLWLTAGSLLCGLLLASCDKPAGEAKQPSAQPVVTGAGATDQQKADTSLVPDPARGQTDKPASSAPEADTVPAEQTADSMVADIPQEGQSTQYMYMVYAGFYDTEQQARMAMQQLIFAGYTCELVHTDIYMLRVMTTRNYAEAEGFMRQLETLGHPDAYVTRRKLTSSEASGDANADPAATAGPGAESEGQPGGK